MKKNIFAFGLLLSFLTAASAMEVQTNIEYGKASDETLLLDVYEPNTAGVFPAVIVVHGGGWTRGDKQGDEKVFAKPLVDANFVCYSINYRLAPKNQWPACYDDVQTAIKWVKANAAKYKTDPNRVAIMGYSAGGQLAALAALTADPDMEVQAVVLVAAPTDLVYDSLRRGNVSTYLMALFGSKGLDEKTLQQLWDISPINYIRTGLPPFLLIHGTADTTVPYQLSLNFKTRLDTVNVPCDVITINGGTHHIEGWNAFNKNYVKEIIEWLSKNLSRK